MGNLLSFLCVPKAISPEEEGTGTETRTIAIAISHPYPLAPAPRGGGAPPNKSHSSSSSSGLRYHPPPLDSDLRSHARTRTTRRYSHAHQAFDDHPAFDPTRSSARRRYSQHMQEHPLHKEERGFERIPSPPSPRLSPSSLPTAVADDILRPRLSLPVTAAPTHLDRPRSPSPSSMHIQDKFGIGPKKGKGRLRKPLMVDGWDMLRPTDWGGSTPPGPHPPPPQLRLQVKIDTLSLGRSLGLGLGLAGTQGDGQDQEQEDLGDQDGSEERDVGTDVHRWGEEEEGAAWTWT